MEASNLLDLTKQVQRLDARQQISELVSRYCTAIDDRDFDSLAPLFAEDAQFEGANGIPSIIQHFQKRTDAYKSSYHYAHAHHADFQSDASAAGVVNGHVEIVTNQNETIWAALRYLDQYVRRGKNWVFHSRVLKFRYVMPLQDLTTYYGQTLRKRWPGLEPQPADIPEGLETYIASRSKNQTPQ